MTQLSRANALKCGLAATVLLIAVVTGIVLYVTQAMPGPQQANAREIHDPDEPDDEAPSETPALTVVDVVHPCKGMDLEVDQPGSVHAYESVQLHARVSGFLKTQTVDIGDKVKRGQTLAVIAVPELDKQLQRDQAACVQAAARVKQTEARVLSAKASRDAALAAIVQADAAHVSASAWVRFRHVQHGRMKELFKLASTKKSLVDESKERDDASLETERAAKAAIDTSKANLAAAVAKIAQAENEVQVAKCDVLVAQAEQERTQVLIDYATIVAPFDGEITNRAFFPGDFIRSASEGAGQKSLLTVQRTDKLRVVVQVPDTAVPFLDRGDRAVVRIDSLPGKQFPGIVSRKTGSEDPNTRLMHVEIDLPNPTGEIGDGMYGKVKIILDRFPGLCSVPTASIVKTSQGRPAVWIVRDHHIHLSEVRLCKGNGSRVALFSGVKTNDLIVLHPPAGLTEGSEVESRLLTPNEE
jgi:HlyD family secretion protein